MVKLNKKRTVCKEFTQFSTHTDLDGKNDAKNASGNKSISDDDPAFDEILRKAKQDIEDLKKDPRKWVKEAEESFKRICNGTAKLGTYNELEAKLNSLGI